MLMSRIKKVIQSFITYRPKARSRSFLSWLCQPCAWISQWAVFSRAAGLAEGVCRSMWGCRRPDLPLALGSGPSLKADHVLMKWPAHSHLLHRGERPLLCVCYVLPAHSASQWTCASCAFWLWTCAGCAFWLWTFWLVNLSRQESFDCVWLILQRDWGGSRVCFWVCVLNVLCEVGRAFSLSILRDNDLLPKKTRELINRVIN